MGMHCNPRNKDDDKGMRDAMPQRDNPEGNRTDEGMLIFDKSDKKKDTQERPQMPRELSEKQNMQREGVSEYRKMKEDKAADHDEDNELPIV